MDFDWETEDIIHRMYGNSSPLVVIYDYAQIGEAAGMVNLSEEAPEGVTHAAERETLRQRQRVLEICMGDLETRRVALARGKRIIYSDWTTSNRLHVNNGPLRSCGRDTAGSGTPLSKTQDRLAAGQRRGAVYWKHYRKGIKPRGRRRGNRSFHHQGDDLHARAHHHH